MNTPKSNQIKANTILLCAQKLTRKDNRIGTDMQIKIIFLRKSDSLAIIKGL